MGRQEYYIKGWLKVFYFLLGLFIGGMGVLAAGALSQQSNQGPAVLMAIASLAVGIYLLALVLRSRLVIDGTHIEVRGAFREKTADLSEVEGFRTLTSRNGSYWQLKLKEGRGSITISQCFDCDGVRAWLQQLTDLDEQDRIKLLNEIEHDQDWGPRPSNAWRGSWAQSS